MRPWAHTYKKYGGAAWLVGLVARRQSPNFLASICLQELCFYGPLYSLPLPRRGLYTANVKTKNICVDNKRNDCDQMSRNSQFESLVE